MTTGRPRLLLHVCCGPCAAHAVDRLQQDYEVTGYFSNSNLDTPEEYRLRLEAARDMAQQTGIRLVEDHYDHAAWLDAVRGFEHEPEQGARCERCFAFSLTRTARYAHAHGFDNFTTTLSVSPHKHSDTLFRVGSAVEGNGVFLPVDLKQDNGYQKSVARSRELGLYRQRYCGCEFSRNSSAASAASNPNNPVR